MRKRIFTFEVFFMLVFSLITPLSIGFNVRISDTNEQPSIIDQDKTLYLGCDSNPFVNEGNGWNHTFGGISYDEGFSVQETNDCGYIIAGATLSYGAGNWDVWLLKIDYYGNEEWNSTFGGSGYDSSYSVQQTNDGGYILTGCTSSYGAGNSDVWLIKTDTNGNEQWNSTFGGSDTDWGYSIDQTSDDGYIITGYTDSYGAGNSDVCLIKIDSSGNQKWYKTFGGSDYDRGRAVLQTNDSGYIITGYTVSYDTDTSGCDVWLIKTDSNGIQQWQKTFGGSGIPNKFDIGYSIKQTSDDGYIIAGDTEIYFISKADFLLIKTDSSGNEEWYKTFGGLSADRGRSVLQTSDGGYVILGWVSSYGPGDSDVWLIKTDSNGNYDWNYTFRFEEDSLDWGYSVQQTRDNGFIIAGSTMPDGWSKTCSSKSIYKEGTDVWLIRIAGENQPPNIPKINGTISGKPGIEYTYCIDAIDPDNDSLYVLWEWGDGSSSDWLGPFVSGEEVCDFHSWEESDIYNISVTLRDEHGESVTAYLKVNIPRNKASYDLLIGVFLRRFPILQKILDYIL